MTVHATKSIASNFIILWVATVAHWHIFTLKHSVAHLGFGLMGRGGNFFFGGVGSTAGIIYGAFKCNDFFILLGRHQFGLPPPPPPLYMLVETLWCGEIILIKKSDIDFTNDRYPDTANTQFSCTFLHKLNCIEFCIFYQLHHSLSHLQQIPSQSAVHWYRHPSRRWCSGSILPHRQGHDCIIPQIRQSLLPRHW